MTLPKGGKPVKGQSIVDGFNREKGVSKADIMKAKREARLEKERQRSLKARQAEELAIINNRLLKLGKQVGLPIGSLPEPAVEPEPVAVDESDDTKSAQDMLQHMRYAYKHSVGPTGKKGRARLVELMETDVEFKFAMKELLKIEAALLTAKIRKEGGDGQGNGGQQNFFVVLKGLEADKSIVSAMQTDKTVDMKQIQQAMNPEEGAYEPEEDVNQREAPEMLLGRLGGGE